MLINSLLESGVESINIDGKEINLIFLKFNKTYDRSVAAALKKRVAIIK